MYQGGEKRAWGVGLRVTGLWSYKWVQRASLKLVGEIVVFFLVLFCVCVCVCVSVCVCAYLCVYTYIAYLCVHIYIYIYMHRL